MALLKPVVKPETQLCQFKLKSETRELLDLYSEFLNGTPKNEIVEQALSRIFKKDEEFGEFLKKRGHSTNNGSSERMSPSV